MKVGLIDVDGHSNFPNLALMKISSFYKHECDSVEWYQPMLSGHMDVVFASKVFSFSEDYEYNIDADVINKGGSGYHISMKDGKEIFNASEDHMLPDYMEHICPDYSLYGIEDTAYGFLSRGCPRGCEFCIVGEKEGRKSYKVANLDEFWKGQKNIVILDPNLLACKDHKELLTQLIDSNAWIDFNQGLDIRLMTEEEAELICKCKVHALHFAWDKYIEKDEILPKFQMFKESSGIDKRKLITYVLCNFDTTIEEDLERIYALKEMGYLPYVMLYDKEHIPKRHIYRKLQRWVNNRFVFGSCDTFDEYLKGKL